MSRYPLGRIHPHGSGGKSIYQRLATAVKGRDGWMFDWESIYLNVLLILGGSDREPVAGQRGRNPESLSKSIFPLLWVVYPAIPIDSVRR